MHQRNFEIFYHFLEFLKNIFKTRKMCYQSHIWLNLLLHNYHLHYIIWQLIFNLGNWMWSFTDGRWSFRAYSDKGSCKITPSFNRFKSFNRTAQGVTNAIFEIKIKGIIKRHVLIHIWKILKISFRWTRGIWHNRHGISVTLNWMQLLYKAYEYLFKTLFRL